MKQNNSKKNLKYEQNKTTIQSETLEIYAGN